MAVVEFVKIFQGESRTIPLRIQHADCTSFDLTGATEIQARFRKSDGQSLIKTLTNEGTLYGGVTVVDAAAGRITVDLGPSDSSQFKIGERQDFTIVIYKGNRATVVLGPNTFKAKVPGSHVNGKQLIFTGLNSVQTVVDAYNESVQPEEEIYFLGSGATVPSAQTITLTGGTDNKRVTNLARAITVVKQAV